MSVQFRNYKAADFDDLAEMVLGLYTKDGQQASAMTVGNVALSVEQLTAPGSAGQIYIFEEKAAIAGYSIVNRFWSNEFAGYIFYIDELYVRPAFRNKGLGAQFFDYLEKNSDDGCVAFMLETVHSNEGAKRFYQKNGFDTHHNHLMFKHLGRKQ
jgi:GNAT superfamily N-acetyltransferase